MRLRNQLVLLAIAVAAIYCVALGIHRGRAQIAPSTAIPIVNVGSSVAANAATAALTPDASQTAYICGFAVTGLGATAGVATTMTITGLASGSFAQKVGVPAGVTVPMSFQESFSPCLPASAKNTAISLSNSSFGSGNTAAQVTAWGYSTQR